MIDRPQHSVALSLLGVLSAVTASGAPLEIPEIATEVTVDGRLDEDAWRQAASISLDWETEPSENTPAEVGTVCLVTHDQRALYVAFRVDEPAPGTLRARLRDRDTAWSDDRVGIILDTFNDQRRAFEFWSNPLGVQIDVFNDGVSGEESDAWDAIWTSAGRITEGGYIVEMAIPFSELPFPSSANGLVWGFDAVRYRPREYVRRLANNPVDRNNDCYLCQIGKISGFRGIQPGLNLEIVSTVVASSTETRPSPGMPFDDGDDSSEAGLTVSWGVTPNLALDATVNPDFSQVEADVARLDVNERFALFFPERRPFFLEGADFFETPFDAVFTRNVADPSWGTKLTGKMGAHGLGAFVARDDSTQLVIPGSQSSRSTALGIESDDAVVRWRRDVGSSSALGILATSREGDGYSNRVLGADGKLRFGESDSLTFQLLGSSTRYPGEVASEFGQPEGSFDDVAASVSYRHDSRNWFWQARAEDVGNDFRADMGFMPRVDYRLLKGTVQRIWWGEENTPIQKTKFAVDIERWVDHDGVVLKQELETYITFDGPLDSFLWIGPRVREQTFAGRKFDQVDALFYSEAQLSSNVFISLWARYGDDVDFDGARPGEILILEPRLRLDLGRHVHVELTHARRRLDIDQGRLFTADLSRFKLVYQLNRRMFVRAIVENTDISRDPALHGGSVEAASQDLFSQLLFSYKLNARTVAFLGYSDTREAVGGLSSVQTGRGLFLKLGVAFKP